MTLFVANISVDVKEDALKALFSEFGTVATVKIVEDRLTGFSKGFGFVEMSNDDHANNAIRRLSSAEFFGKKLIVSKAKPKTTTYR